MIEPGKIRSRANYLPQLDLQMPVSMPQGPRKCSCRRNLSPIVENSPISADETLNRYQSFLMPYELTEVRRFTEIYFVGHPDSKSTKPYDIQFHYKVNPRDHLAYRYEVLKILGSGSFGQVVEAIDHKTKKRVAIKILINTDDMKEQSRNEASILATLNKNHATNTIKGLDFFVFRSHACITFELLGPNLYTVAANHSFRPLKPSAAREYAVQIFKGLSDCAKFGIIHADLKPENICVTLEDRKVLKIIDFGSSCFENKRIYNYIQSRYYRSPEVILELKYGTPIDVWSAALVVIEMLTGRPLLPGKNELDMLNLMAELLGPPPKYMIKASMKKKLFFYEDCSLKASYSSKLSHKKYRTLEEVLGVSASPQLLDFLRKCLTWDPLARMTASQALDHPWLQQKTITVHSKDMESLPSLQKYLQNFED